MFFILLKIRGYPKILLKIIFDKYFGQFRENEPEKGFRIVN
jgi:hypothetical protein